MYVDTNFKEQKRIGSNVLDPTERDCCCRSRADVKMKWNVPLEIFSDYM